MDHPVLPRKRLLAVTYLHKKLPRFGSHMNFSLTAAESREYDRHRPQRARGPACHAPTNSLYIGIGGMITACCVNRTHLLGRYPEQSLEEAWRGLQRQELERAIGAGDLSKGCQVC